MKDGSVVKEMMQETKRVGKAGRRFFYETRLATSCDGVLVHVSPDISHQDKLNKMMG